MKTTLWQLDQCYWSLLKIQHSVTEVKTIMSLAKLFKEIEDKLKPLSDTLLKLWEIYWVDGVVPEDKVNEYYEKVSEARSEEVELEIKDLEIKVSSDMEKKYDVSDVMKVMYVLGDWFSLKD